MNVSIHQPSYFPWLGLLNKIALSDLFILMDDVQLADRAYQHRNIFLMKDETIKYLTISISKKRYREKKIRDLEVSGNEWQKKHYNFLKQHYNSSLFFEEVFEKVKFIFIKNYKFLIDVLVDSMTSSFALFNIQPHMIFQSKLKYDSRARKSDLILSLVKSVHGEKYISGTGAKSYLSLKDFTENGIAVTFNEFHHPVYHQSLRRNGSFVSGLSCLDMLFNLGINEARNVFWGTLKN